MHGAARRRAGLRLPRRGGPGRRPARRDGRGSRRGRRPVGAPGRVPRLRRRPVRRLHAGDADGGRRPDRTDPEPDGGRGARRPGRRALPVHRIHLDRRCRPRDRVGRRDLRAGPGGRCRGRRAHRPHRRAGQGHRGRAVRRRPADRRRAGTCGRSARHTRMRGSASATSRRSAPATRVSSGSSPPPTCRATTGTGSTRPARTSRSSPTATSGTAARPCWRSSATRRPWPRSPTTSCRSTWTPLPPLIGIDAALDPVRAPAPRGLGRATSSSRASCGWATSTPPWQRPPRPRPGRSRRPTSSTPTSSPRRGPRAWSTGASRSSRPPRRRTWTATSWRWSSACPRTASASSRARAAAGSAASSTCRCSR